MQRAMIKRIRFTQPLQSIKFSPFNSHRSFATSSKPQQPPQPAKPVTITNVPPPRRPSPSQFNTASDRPARDQLGMDMHNAYKVPPINTIEALAEETERRKKARVKNIALGSLLLVFVVWSYFNSIKSVRHAADSISGANLDAIQKELDEEEETKINKVKK